MARVSALWIVIPSYDEAENLAELLPAVLDQLDALPGDGQALVVDDGSRDGTPELLSLLSARYPNLSTHRSRRNQGKASALRRGFRQALDGGAETIVMMDADGQDDPAELPRLLERIAAGDDLVTGARGRRQDRFIKRTTSRLYNRVTGLLSRAPGTDFNSGYKAMTAELARELVPSLYGELHRYITVIAHWRGFRITEVQVAHHPRRYGTSKYGLARFWRGFVDLLTIRFLLAYEQRPSHLFSAVGALSALAGGGILIYLLIDWLTGHSIGDRPLLIAGVLLFLTGLQLVVFGLLAELVVHGRQRDRAWADER